MSFFILEKLAAGIKELFYIFLLIHICKTIDIDELIYIYDYILD